ncbi:MAG: type VI secretion system secreted protein Hcp [Paracoccaceae bacterium]|jgi:type VI secretion system secreted protein Hcp
MALKMILELDSVKGESQVKGNEGKIDIDSYNLDFHQSGTFHRGSGGGGGNVSVGDLVLSKKLDKASADLTKKVCGGMHYKSAKLTVLKSTGEGMEVYYTITLTDCIVASYNIGGGSDGQDYINETFSLNFRHIATQYMVQDAAGILADGGSMEFNVATNELA